jgi:hypothetical protein
VSVVVRTTVPASVAGPRRQPKGISPGGTRRRRVRRARFRAPRRPPSARRRGVAPDVRRSPPRARSPPTPRPWRVPPADGGLGCRSGRRECHTAAARCRGGEPRGCQRTAARNVSRPLTWNPGVVPRGRTPRWTANPGPPPPRFTHGSYSGPPPARAPARHRSPPSTEAAFCAHRP